MNEEEQGPSYRLRRPGGDVDSSRFLNVPGVVLVLAGLMVIFFVLLVVSPERAMRIIEFSAAVSPKRFLLGPEANGGWIRMLSPLVTHMFVHASLAHLTMNTLFLLAVGAPVARRMNCEGALQSFSAFLASLLFVLFFFLSGIAGALAYVALHQDDITLLVGASGGVTGLFGAVVRFAFNRTTLFGPEYASISPLNSPSVMSWSIVIILLNVLVGLFGGALTGGISIAWEAHVGGYLFGLLTYPLFERLALSIR